MDVVDAEANSQEGKQKKKKLEILKVGLGGWRLMGGVGGRKGHGFAWGMV